MNSTDILNTVAEIIAEVVGVDPALVTTEKSFVNDLDIDSLALVEMNIVIEDRFDLKIPDERVADLTTVGDMVSYIAEHR
ncbi:acyl carrier protein [Streptomyces griseoviridis]|uniref:Acyl carrier protein n=1 Tax=Streptomyces hintoniae TaxID=3075521 RepID=A0ABU2ULD5_9ACTN|nr:MULTISPECIES: acyl carrier protein [Streptomyces]MDH6699504.1 acyl carrier protein [Streptomyces sp. MAA16]MDT0474081.1 acyl carrier protein [Streptomyces sp. DSM 41014]